MLLDLHVHSFYTPGVPWSVAQLAERARQAGLDGFCLTDVHTVAALKEAGEVESRTGLRILVGLEAFTDRGHFLVLVPSPYSLPEIGAWLRRDDSGRCMFESLRQAVEARDGLLIAAHPYDRDIPGALGDGLARLAGVGAVEVLNARRRPLQNDLAEEAAAGAGLPGVGGSDVRDSLEVMGTVATLIRGEVQNEAQLIARIRAFDSWPITLGRLAPEPERPASRFPEGRPARERASRTGGREGSGPGRPRRSAGAPDDRPRRGGRGGRRGEGPRPGSEGEKRPRGRHRGRRKGPAPGE
ncbi:MAG: PHP domain-containing protein [Myxococcales bacterium]|nr:PHP domain-containing protein [Myxococcales bacterium]